MKRGLVDSHRFYGSLEDSKVKHKYHCLMEDYLELQKEFISKKKKLQTEKEKRDSILDEVRFLRQRLNYLTKPQLTEVESELGVYQNADVHDAPIRKDMNHIVNQSVMEQEGTEREELAWMKPCLKKKPKNCLISDNNKSAKRKISWQDNVVLRV